MHYNGFASMIKRLLARFTLRDIGYLFVGFAIAGVFILVGILAMGVVADQMNDIFTDLNVSSTWTDLANTATNYISNAMNIALVGIILIGVAVIVWIIVRFGGGITGSSKTV